MEAENIRGIRLLNTILLLILVLFIGWGHSFAQDEPPIASVDAVSQKELAKEKAVEPEYRQELGKVIVVKEEYLPNELDTYVRFMGRSGAGGQSGKVGIVDSATEYSYEVKAFGKLPVQLGFSSGYIGIDNTTAVDLPAHLTSASIGVETTLPFFNIDKTYLTLGLAPSFFSDKWDFDAQDFSLLQRYFLIYQPNERWVFICGVNYSPGFEDPVAPILGFIYRPNDRLALSIIPDSPEISYALNDKLTAFVQGDFTSDEYRVKTGERKNEVLNYNEMHAGGGLRYKWNKNISGSFTAGGVFDRSIRYREDSLGKVALDSGYFIELRLVMAV